MKAWTITTPSERALVYADNRQAAAAQYRDKHPGAKIRGIRPNYHAQNMHPRPVSWGEYIALGGEA